MLTKFEFYNIDGINSYALNEVKSPMHDFEMTVSQRTTTDRNKAEAHGVNATRTLRGGLEVHVEGDIFGDDSADYWAERKALLLGLFGDPNNEPVLTDREYGYLLIGFAGETEDWQTSGCTITTFSAPIQGLSPSRTPYLITFFAWLPYFVGANSGYRYWGA